MYYFIFIFKTLLTGVQYEYCGLFLTMYSFIKVNFQLLKGKNNIQSIFYPNNYYQGRSDIILHALKIHKIPTLFLKSQYMYNL